ncbi:uncharacterized protein LOC109831026 [Asparagus officinalis]|uniref:uncharacterized protein LOC109831026 n=1 Tax=Asparagus officinalis TaxID=4686 RepID=UPI00098E6E5A|nr:uncharacterized protein LOC109831026 [Asparagus officinalis]
MTRIPHAEWVDLMDIQLTDTAQIWWAAKKTHLERPILWETFIEHFNKKYFPQSARDELLRRFVELKQGGRHQFQKGLDKYIRMALAGRALATHDAVLDAAREIESVHKEPEDSHVIQSRTPAAPARNVYQEAHRKQSQQQMFMMSAVEAEANDQVITSKNGKVLVSSVLALSLFDSGASHCFLSRRFASAHSLPISPLTTGWNINTGSGVLVASSGYEACPVVIYRRELFADFLVIDLPSFDAVFGMDWLGSFFATIDCRRRIVVFEIPDHPRFEFTSGSTSAGPMEYRARPKKATLAAMQVESEKPDVV